MKITNFLFLFVLFVFSTQETYSLSADVLSLQGSSFSLDDEQRKKEHKSLLEKANIVGTRRPRSKPIKFKPVKPKPVKPKPVKPKPVKPKPVKPKPVKPKPVKPKPVKPKPVKPKPIKSACARPK